MFVIDSRRETQNNVPMTNSTHLNDKTSSITNLKNKLVRPTKDTLFFLQLFARIYEPQMMMGVA